MPSLWRISQYPDLRGEGGRRTDNRWNRRGKPIVYLAQTVAGVILEHMVHIMDNTRLPVGLKLIHVNYPDSLKIASISESDLPDGWHTNVECTRNAGDQWLKNSGSALLRVPSSIAPDTVNVLLNLTHPNVAQVEIIEHISFDLEPRLNRLADYALSYRTEVRYVARDE